MANPFLKPVPLSLLALAVVLFAIGQPIIAGLALVFWIGVLAISSIKQTAVSRSSDVSEELDPDSKILFSPVKRTAAEIESLAAQKTWGALTFVAQEAGTESKRIRDEVARALLSRRDLKRALRDRSLAMREIEKLQEQIAVSLSEEEKDSLELALEARKIELTHYDKAQKALEQIDVYVREAEAALAELKARLTAGLSVDAADDSEELRETLGRLKSIGASFDEAEAFLKGK